MLFFSNEYEGKLDAKGRLVLPAKIKSNLPQDSGHEIVLRRGFEPCLVIYSVVEFKKIYSKVAGLNEFNEKFRKFQRIFFSGNALVELDNMGRFIIPKSMIKYAQLDREVIIVGVGSRAEIWNPELYNKHMTLDDKDEFSEMAEKYLSE